MSNNSISAADLTSALKGINFPCSKEDLINKAKENSASQEVLESLENLQSDSYENITAVTQSFGEEK
jgi:hypothetical protein